MLLDDLLANGYHWKSLDGPKRRYDFPLPVHFAIDNVAKRIGNHAFDLTDLNISHPAVDIDGDQYFFEWETEKNTITGALAIWSKDALALQWFFGHRLSGVKNISTGYITLPTRPIAKRPVQGPFMAVFATIALLNDPDSYTWKIVRRVSRAEHRRNIRSGHERLEPLCYRKVILKPDLKEEYERRGRRLDPDGLPRRLPFHSVIEHTRPHPKDHSIRIPVRSYVKGDPRFGVIDHLYVEREPDDGPGLPPKS